MTYRAGVVGVGRVGRNHAEAFMETAGLELTSIVDVDEDVVTELGDHWNVSEERRYHDHVEMLATERLDVVSVATPDRCHFEHVLDIARAPTPPGVILCEKPIATTLGRATEMVRVCEQAGVELVVNHSRRFSSAIQSLHRLLHEDALLGELRSAHLVAGPELLNLGTHYVDLLLYLFDARVEDVRGGYVEPVTASDGVRFEGGATIVLDTGAVVHVDPIAGSTSRLYVEGSAGRLSIPLSIAQDADGSWEYWSVENGTRTVETLPSPLEAHWQADITGTHSTYEPGMVPAQPLFEGAASHLVDLLSGEVDNASPGSRAAHGLSVLVAMVLSDATGSRIPLPLADTFEDVSLVRPNP